MNPINRNNYEAFLLDYMEQNLSSEMVAELMLFLENNPDLKQEWEEMNELVLTDTPKVIFEDKETLKKEAIENLMIAEIEGINTPAQSEELKRQIDNDKENEKTFLLYQKTILKPQAISFADKEGLKQKEGKVIPLYWWASSVAAIIIMVLLLRGLNTTEKVTPSELASSSQNQEKSNVETIDQKELINNTPSSDNQVANLPIEKKEEKEESTTPKTTEKTKHNNHQLPVQPKVVKQDEIEENTFLAEENEQEDLIEEKDSIIILPPAQPTEELLADNNIKQLVTNEKKPLSVSQFLKKEVKEKVFKDNSTEPKPTEVVVADILAKAAGKRASVDKKKNEEGEVEEYALNIGGFSFSRKIRK